MKKITPFLWFDNQAEEAVKFYTSVFPNSKIESITRYDEVAAKASGRVKGSAMTVSFELDGQEFAAINGGPYFKFSEAVSFVINCETQEEVDYYWEKLSADPKAEQCGWIKDKYGLSWQVVPTLLYAMLNDENPEKVARVSEALLKMKKLDLNILKKAFEG